MSERKDRLAVAWAVWLDVTVSALRRAREDRLGCRIDVPARGGDAVCELLDGAEVIGRYVAMGAQPALPLGEPAPSPTGFQRETATKPQEPAPVETEVVTGYQAAAEAATRAPVGEPASALGELLAAAEGTLLPHAQGPVTVRSLRPVADLRAEEQAPAITEALKRKLETPDCALCHSDAPTALQLGVTVFVWFPGARLPEAYTLHTLVAEDALLEAPDAALADGRARPPTLRAPREAVRWAASDEGDGGRWEYTAPAADVPDGETKRWRYGISPHTLATLPPEALAALARIHPTRYAWADLNGGGSPAWWMVYPLDGSMGSTTAPALYDFGAAHKVSYLTRQDTPKDRAQLAALPYVTLAEAAATSAEMVRATKAPAKDTATKRAPAKAAPTKKTAATKAPTANRDPKPENVSEKPAKGDAVRVLLVPSADWEKLAKGLKGWDPAKTPGARRVIGGAAAPLALVFAPAAHPDVDRLLARLATAKIPYTDRGEVEARKAFDHDPALRAVREAWNEDHPNRPVTVGEAPRGWAKQPAPTIRRSLATPPTTEDVQEAEALASAVQEGFFRPVVAAGDWAKLSGDQRARLTSFQMPASHGLGAGAFVTGSWNPSDDGLTVVGQFFPMARRSALALRLDTIAAELGVPLRFEPHPVTGTPTTGASATDVPPASEAALGDAPASPAKRHRQTPEPAADKRAGRGRHTILAQDASGAWTKRERHGEIGPVWTKLARELAASGLRVRVYDGKPRCTWDSLDEPAVPFEQPDPEPTAEPTAEPAAPGASPEPGHDASPSAATDAPGTVRVWIAEDQWEALHPDDRSAFEHPDVDVELVWEGGYQHVATTMDARGLAALRALLTARELDDLELREDAPPTEPADVTLYLDAVVWEGMDEAPRAELANASGRSYAAYRDGVSPWRAFGPMPRASADRMMAEANRVGLQIYDVEPGTGTTYRDRPHDFDTRVTGVGACIALRDQHGPRLVARAKKASDADWRRDVGQIVSGATGLAVARIYDRKGRCTWDARDGGAIRIALGVEDTAAAPRTSDDGTTARRQSATFRYRDQHDPGDTSARSSHANVAVLMIVTDAERGEREFFRRRPNLPEATWRVEAKTCLESVAHAQYARLYSQRGKCIWDSRDPEKLV